MGLPGWHTWLDVHVGILTLVVLTLSECVNCLTCAPSHSYPHSHKNTHTHAHTHAYTNARVRTHTHTHTRTHACARTHMYTHAQTHKHTHARTHAHTHTHTHTHTHVCAGSYLLRHVGNYVIYVLVVCCVSHFPLIKYHYLPGRDATGCGFQCREDIPMTSAELLNPHDKLASLLKPLTIS